MKTSLVIWEHGDPVNPAGYKPELSEASTVQKVTTAVSGLGELIDDYEFHFPQELNREGTGSTRPRRARCCWSTRTPSRR